MSPSLDPAPLFWCLLGLAIGNEVAAALTGGFTGYDVVRSWLLPALALTYWAGTARRYLRLRGTDDPALRKRSAAYTRVLLSQLLVAFALFGR